MRACLVSRLMRSAALAPALAAVAANAGPNEWPSYNNTLQSDRFSGLDQITKTTAASLKPVCTYDTGLKTSFQTGPIVAEGTMFFTTEKETFAIDPAACTLRWRITEDYQPASPLKVNRGAAYADGIVVRGLQDGRVIAYASTDGKKLWERPIGDAAKGETVPAAPIIWDGLVFIGNAGGDNFGVKGRIYALDLKTGEIRWTFWMTPQDQADTQDRGNATGAGAVRASWENKPETPITGGTTWTSYSLDPDAGILYVPGGNAAPDFRPDLRPGNNLYTDSIVALDARTGAYLRHVQITENDFHDWDASTPPALITSRTGTPLFAASEKDGFLHVYDRKNWTLLFKKPVTTIENAEARFTEEGTRFCPGTQGGSEWNGAAYDAGANLIFTGAVDWCVTVKIEPGDMLGSVHAGQPYSGGADKKHVFGEFDSKEKWAGWVRAFDAGNGEQRWAFKTPAPVLGGITPTAGGLVFAGDMNGTIYALASDTGEELWSADTGGALGGGIITYAVEGKQYLAAASGMTSPIWLARDATARIVVYGSDYVKTVERLPVQAAQRPAN